MTVVTLRDHHWEHLITFLEAWRPFAGPWSNQEPPPEGLICWIYVHPEGGYEARIPLRD